MKQLLKFNETTNNYKIQNSFFDICQTKCPNDPDLSACFFFLISNINISPGSQVEQHIYYL